jgi:cell division protein FtsN
MKKGAATLTICLILLLAAMGCSKEEPPAPPPKRPQKIKIVKPPKLQEPEKEKAPIPDRQEKEETTAQEAEGGAITVVEELPKRESEEGTQAAVVKKSVQVPKEVVEEAKAITKEAIEERPAEVETKQVQVPEEAVEEEETEAEQLGGYYIVKKGESLCDVASREDVYGNRLKWPILYRCNMDTLGDLKTEGDVVERALPEGLKLRIIGPDEVEKNLKKRPNNRWVINVLSTTTNERLVPISITLIKSGHSAYLIRARIKGKVWTRLRVGFFTSKAEADAQRKKIRDLLGIDDPWSVKLGPMEFAEFAGY